MARTAAFRRLRRLMRCANRANRSGIGDGMLEELLERRRFLQIGAAAAASVTLAPSGFAGSFLRPPRSRARKLADPVLIIGAGGAGLAAAYTLKKADVPFFMIEATNRVGGRIATQTKFNTDLQFCERGAELVDTGHETLIGLAGELGVAIEDFAPGDAGFEPELFWFGGKLRTEHEFVSGLKPLLEKIAAARDALYGGVDEYITYATTDALPGAAQFDVMSLKEFLDATATDVERWIRDAVEVAYLGEYGRDTSEQSAINLIDLIDVDADDGFTMFGESDEAKRVKGGSSQLTQALLDALTEHGKVAEEKFLRKDHPLVAIREAPEGLLCVFHDPGGKVLEQKASQVICTIPFSVLREVEGVKALPLSPVKQECIARLGYGSNSKVMLSFKSRFWRQPQGAVPKNVGSMYGDFASQNIWETSRLQDGKRGILTSFLGGKAGLEASNETAETVLKDLTAVYGGSLARDQYDNVKVVMNWNKMPFVKASYGCLRPGQYTTIWGSAGEPEMDGKLLFAGEHTSLDWQGYMNGAYESGVAAANAVLERRGAEVEVGR